MRFNRGSFLLYKIQINKKKIMTQIALKMKTNFRKPNKKKSVEAFIDHDT